MLCPPNTSVLARPVPWGRLGTCAQSFLKALLLSEPDLQLLPLSQQKQLPKVTGSWLPWHWLCQMLDCGPKALHLHFISPHTLAGPVTSLIKEGHGRAAVVAVV